MKVEKCILKVLISKATTRVLGVFLPETLYGSPSYLKISIFLINFKIRTLIFKNSNMEYEFHMEFRNSMELIPVEYNN